MKYLAYLFVLLGYGSIIACTLFAGWFTLAFFGFEMSAILVAAVCGGLIIAIVLRAVTAWRGVRRGDLAI